MAELELASFQRTAVERICERLRKGSRRFLLADEVGLGKTIVAREVIQQLAAHRRHFVVVYLCSNAEIAEQNREKLDPDAGKPLSRVTELAIHRQDQDPRKVRLYSFTPGTSLNRGTGMYWERQLLLFLVRRVLGKKSSTDAWREFFRCGVNPERWWSQTEPSSLRAKFSKLISPKLRETLARIWAEPVAADNEFPAFIPTRDLDAEVLSFSNESEKHRRRRNHFVKAMRHGLQRAAIEHLKPDLVILDEVQRFRDVLKEEQDAGSISGQLFRGEDTAVLILSATPYRMLSLRQEGAESGSHYEDFLDTIAFLQRRAPGSHPPKLKADLRRFGERLDQGQFLSAPDPELRALKQSIERRLRKVMCRTERNRYLQDPGKGIEEAGTEEDERVPGPEELAEYLRLRRFLLDKVPSSYHITEFWKSSPSPFTFMESHYAVMQAVRRHASRRLEAGLVTPGKALVGAAERHHRFRTLFRRFFAEDETTPWKYLWTRPTYPYYRDEFFGERPPRKLLIFSSWRFVPKAISVLFSQRAERGLRQPKKDTTPLRFGNRSAWPVFSLCFPSIGLASLIDPASLASQGLTVRELQRRAERALEARLKQLNVTVGEGPSAPSLRIVARLDAACERAGEVCALLQSWRPKDDETPLGFRREIDKYLRWFSQAEEPLVLSRKRFQRLAQVAAFSPAVSLLRALWSVYDELRGALPPDMLDLCMNVLRHYFNRRYVQTAVKACTRGKSYSVRVLDYCADAHLQAVLDEYAFLLANVQQRAAAEAVEHLGRVFGLGLGAPTINSVSSGSDGVERLKKRPHAMRAHLALAFGDEGGSEPGSPLDEEESKESRKTAIRESFNSPFWPFVLATTSVGQEGLDFHLYCRDIVHWNLPSNPVDLEQREGRINRRDGLAIRQNIALDWPLERLGPPREVGATNIWRRVFRALDETPDVRRYMHGLFPHWVYERPAGETVRLQRHLVFSSHSSDAAHYQQLKARLVLYRVVFGQPRQQDMLERLEEHLKQLSPAAQQDARRMLPSYMIDLSPFKPDHALREARREAEAMSRDASAVEHLLQAVQSLVESRPEELGPVGREVEELSAFLRRSLAAAPEQEPARIREALAALIYLPNPFDAEFDLQPQIGLEDDIRIIRDAHARLKR